MRCIVSNTPMDTSFPSAYRVMLVNRDLRLIIEQDMYPAQPGNAKAIATRTRRYFASVGLPPAEQ